jgi:hypothetical protein
VRVLDQEQLQLAEHRLSRFWADVIPAIQAQWALIWSAAEVLIEADRVRKALKMAPNTVSAPVKAYVDNEEPWCFQLKQLDLLRTSNQGDKRRSVIFRMAIPD